MIEWHSKKIKVSQLKEYAGNPRDFTEKGMKDLKKSIDKFGVAEPICCNPDLTIIGGHARKKTLVEMGIKEVLVHLPERKLTDEEVKELNIRLNKNQAGIFNMDILANEFELTDLLDWGFEAKELGSAGTIPKDLELNSIFEIAVECSNEEEQKELYEKFINEGLRCRLLTL